MIQKKQIPGFMMYWDILHTLLRLQPEDMKKALMAIEKFYLDGEQPSPGETFWPFWPLISQKLQTDRERYESRSRFSRVGGLISHFKRNFAPANGLDPNDDNALYSFLKENHVSDQDIDAYTHLNVRPPIQPNTYTTTNTTTKTNTNTKTDILFSDFRRTNADESMKKVISDFCTKNPVSDPQNTGLSQSSAGS